MLVVVGFLNFFLVQFLFFRIAIRYENGVPTSIGLLFPMLPLTGWALIRPFTKIKWPKYRKIFNLYN